MDAHPFRCPPVTDARRLELRERVRRLQLSLAETDDDGAPAYPERAMNRFSQELLRVEKEYQAFLDDHARVHAAAGAVPGASSIQRRLAADQALLEYVVGPESLVVFVLTARGIAVKSSPLREADLAARIELLRDLIRRPGDDRWRSRQRASPAELFDPLERAGWLDGVTPPVHRAARRADLPAICAAAATGNRAGRPADRRLHRGLSACGRGAAA